MTRLALILALLVVTLSVMAGAISAGCASRRAQPADVQSLEWVLATIDGFEPPLSRRPTMRFEGAARVLGRAYVNQYWAACELNADGTIRVDTIASTKMSGPPEWLEDERRYLARLRSARTWKLKGDTLTLTAAEGESLAFTKP
ncbi:MAG: META domain-containing protein [Phycisphaerales bacterium]